MTSKPREGLTQVQKAKLARALYASMRHHASWWHDIEGGRRLVNRSHEAFEVAADVAGRENGPEHTAVWLTLALCRWPGAVQRNPDHGGDLGQVVRDLGTSTADGEFRHNVGARARLVEIMLSRGAAEQVIAPTVGLVRLARAGGHRVDYVRLACDLAVLLDREDHDRTPGGEWSRWQQVQHRWMIHCEGLKEEPENEAVFPF